MADTIYTNTNTNINNNDKNNIIIKNNTKKKQYKQTITTMTIIKIIITQKNSNNNTTNNNNNSSTTETTTTNSSLHPPRSPRGAHNPLQDGSPVWPTILVLCKYNNDHFSSSSLLSFFEFLPYCSRSFFSLFSFLSHTPFLPPLTS